MKQTLKVITLAVACLAGSRVAQAADAPAADPTRFEQVVVRAAAQFDFDKDVVKPEDQERILGELGKAGKVTWQSVNAVGYTDSIGSAQYNQGLSKRRADAVKALLVSKGVDGGMIATEGRGDGDPVADNGSESGRSQNRRTAIEFQGVRANE